MLLKIYYAHAVNTLLMIYYARAVNYLLSPSSTVVGATKTTLVLKTEDSVRMQPFFPRLKADKKKTVVKW